MNDRAALFAPDERRDALRKLGGLLVAAALLMTFIRKSSPGLGDTWGDWGLLLLLLATFGFLYGTALIGRQNTLGLRSWQAVYFVFAIFIVPLVGAQFVAAVNGTPGASLNIFWFFLLTAALAGGAAIIAGVRYGLLLASIAVIISWSALWEKILSGGLGEHLGLYRVLLLIIGALLVLASLAVAGAGREERSSAAAETAPPPWSPASELVTGAALAAVLAGSLSFTKLVALSNPFLDIPGADSSFFWELVLLVVSLAAIGYGSRVGARGPAYVGGFGLFSFLLIAGLDLNSTTPAGKIVGWPLALLIIGLAVFLAGMRPDGATRSSGATGGTGAAPPPSG